MSNTLLRVGNVTVIPAITAVPFIPAYTYTYPTTYTVILRTASGRLVRNTAPGAGGGSATGNPKEFLWIGGGIFVDQGSKQVTIYTTVEVPAQPAVAGVPGQRIAVPPPGWTSFARSIGSIFSVGTGQFNVEPGVSGVVVGFASLSSPKVGYGHLPHGLLFTGGKVSNAKTNEAYGNYVATDLFKIVVNTTSVQLQKNGATLATETSLYALGPLYLSAVLNSVGDSVMNPAIATARAGSGALSFGRLVVHAATAAYGAASMSTKPMRLDGGVGEYGQMAFGRMSAFGSQTTMFGQGAMSIGLVVEGYGGMVEAGANNAGDMSFGRMLSAGISLTGGLGEGAPKFGRLTMLGAQAAYASSAMGFKRMTVDGYNEPEDEAYLFEGVQPRITLTSVTELVALMIDGVMVGATMASSQLLDAVMADLVNGTSSMATNQLLDALMLSFANMGDGFVAPGVGSDTWVYSPGANGSTQYRNFGFNSFGRIGDRYYGASDDGLFELEGDTDVGEPIRASFGIGKLDFGTATKKTVSEAYIGMSAAGNLFIKVVADGAEYVYQTRNFSDQMQQQRVTFGKGLRTNYVEFEFYNEEGADFEIDTVEFRVADLTRRI